MTVIFLRDRSTHPCDFASCHSAYPSDPHHSPLAFSRYVLRAVSVLLLISIILHLLSFILSSGRYSLLQRLSTFIIRFLFILRAPYSHLSPILYVWSSHPEQGNTGSLHRRAVFIDIFQTLEGCTRRRFDEYALAVPEFCQERIQPAVIYSETATESALHRIRNQT